MGYLILLTIAGLIGLSLRMIVVGEFEINQFLLLLLFPLAAIGILYFQRHQVKKDQSFEPINSKGAWVIRLGDTVFNRWKPLYAEQLLKGQFRRYYQSSWKMLVAETMRSTGRWYLNLMFEMKDGRSITFENPQENRLIGNDRWAIFENDEIVGEVRTDLSFKNATQLKGRLKATIGQTEYVFQTYVTNSQVEVFVGNTMIGRGQREKGYQYYFRPMTTNEDEAMYLTGIFILITYYFNT
ncbi:hypothetical protein [Alkalibacillus haloalkaliphilus]|uniref:hypothetical protein n=1 Tax=Alkalibacillus haloalkaliphilus TaxID=94136 RepID=UPI0002F76D0E|nr:hypothetical protein [Alkalibacillus haloalkaliphilus]